MSPTPALFLDASVGIADFSFDQQRALRYNTASASLDRVAESSFGAEQWIATLTGGYNYSLADWSFTPSLNYEWSRTGHLTVSKSVAASEKFTSLPFRKNIAEITSTGYSLPNSVVRQRAIETIVGEEISNMTLSKKSVADTAKSAEERVNKLLSSVK